MTDRLCPVSPVRPVCTVSPDRHCGPFLRRQRRSVPRPGTLSAAACTFRPTSGSELPGRTGTAGRWVTEPRSVGSGLSRSSMWPRPRPNTAGNGRLRSHGGRGSGDRGRPLALLLYGCWGPYDGGVRHGGRLRTGWLGPDGRRATRHGRRPITVMFHVCFDSGWGSGNGGGAGDVALDGGLRRHAGRAWGLVANGCGGAGDGCGVLGLRPSRRRTSRRWTRRLGPDRCRCSGDGSWTLWLWVLDTGDRHGRRGRSCGARNLDPGGRWGDGGPWWLGRAVARKGKRREQEKAGGRTRERGGDSGRCRQSGRSRR